MHPKTSYFTGSGNPQTRRELKVVFDLNNLPRLGLVAEDLTKGTTTQFANALRISAKSLGTELNCCDTFCAGKVSFQTKDHWFYVTVDPRFLSTYWTGDSADSSKVEQLLRNAFGLFAVLSQDPEQHHVLQEGDLECALKTARGLIPEYANMANPKAKRVAKLVSFMN